jgi:hypothetical protein
MADVIIAENEQPSPRAGRVVTQFGVGGLAASSPQRYNITH